MSNLVPCDPTHPPADLIQRAARIIRRGGLVAFPTETVYGLGANALDPVAVGKIFAAKQRPHWDPLIVHVTGVEMASALAAGFPPLFAQLTEVFWPGPLTLVVEKSARIPPAVTAQRSQVALRMPRHPVIAALLAAADCPIAAPSANRFGRPSPTHAQHVADDLGAAVDLILDGGPTPLGVESTVLNLTTNPPAILRPGGISREQLETVIGPVIAAAPIIETAATEGLASPGTTHRHYAPEATVELFEDQATLAQRAAQLRGQGRRVGVLDAAADLERYAHDLYAQLRALDQQHVEVILARLPPPVGLGCAIRDRLTRAAAKDSSQIGIARASDRR